MRSRAARIAKRVLVAALISWAAYIAAIYAFVGTGFVARLINEDQDDVELEHASAWSWIPGLLEVRGLKIRGHDSHVVWSLDVDEAHAWISPIALFQKTLRLRSAVARGVEMSILMREDPSRRAPLDLSKLWTVDLDLERGEDVRSVSVEGYKFLGAASVSGGFFLFPTQRMRLEPTRAEITMGSLVRPTGQEIARNLRGEATIEISEVAIPETHGLQIFRAVTANAELSALISSVRFANAYLASENDVRLLRGSGQLEAKVEIARGLIGKGTKATFASKNIQARVVNDVISGAGRATFAVGRVGRMSVVLDRFQSKKGNADKPYVQGRELRVEAVTRALDLVDPFRTLEVDVNAPSAFVRDLRAFNEYLPEDARITAGTASVGVSLHLPDMEGKVSIDAQGAGFKVKSAELLGDVDVTAKFSGRDRIVAEAEIPKLTLKIPGLFEMRDAKGQIRAEAAKENIAMRELSLRSGNMEILGRALVEGKKPARAAFLVRWAAFAAALEIEGKETHVELINPTDHYQRFALELERKMGRVKQVGPPEPLVDISKPE